MSSKVKRIHRLLIFSILCCFLFSSISFAGEEAMPVTEESIPVSEEAAEVSMDFGSGGSFFEAGAEGRQKFFDEIDEDSSPFVFMQSLVIYVGIITAVVVATIYGIQWVMATPSKKQQLKEGLVPLIIGVTLLAIGPKLTIILVESFM